MVPLPLPSVVNYLLLSGLAGFAVFCGSYAYHVWRRRNRGVNPQLAGHRFASALRRASIVSAAFGGLLIAVAMILREVILPQGVLVGNGIFTLRSRPENSISQVTSNEVVAKGEVIAHVSSPELDAEHGTYAAQKMEHEAEMARVELEPLVLDPELTRRHQNIINQQSQLRASRDQILPARDLVARQATHERHEKLERLAQLEVTLGTTRGALEEARQKQAFSLRELARAQQAGKRNAISASEEEEARKNVSVLEAEISKLRAQASDLTAEKQQLEANLQALESLNRAQLTSYTEELDRLGEKASAALADEQALAAKLADDRRRALRVRAEDLRRLAMKIDQAASKLAGIEEQRTIAAPLAGKVFFRDAAPQSAADNEPVLVIGPEDGFRLRLRLSNRQAAALADAVDLPVELVEAAVQPRFLARSLSAEPLHFDPGYSLVELACAPPPATVRAVANGAQVSARLVWRPPLLTVPLFQAGAWALLLGAIGTVAIGTVAIGGKTDGKEQAAAPPPPSPATSGNGFHAVDPGPFSIADAHPANGSGDGSAIESGAAGVVLDSLSHRLRDAILRHQLDPALIGAVEWSLDRHHARAVKMFVKAIEPERPLADALMEMRSALEHAEAFESPGHETQRQRELWRRLLRILRVLRPGLAREWLLDR